MPIVTRYSHLHALVIDDQPTQQATLRGHLNLLGIGKVDGTTNPDGALKQIRRTDYQLILCDYNLDTRTDGQQLLEHLRESQSLPVDCLFFMITAEASYASVAAASEHHPDAYLLKPATAADIAERLKSALDRRAAVLPVMQAIKDRDDERAVVEADAAVARGGRHALYALQLKAQTLLRLARPEDARLAYEEALALKPGLVWARLGLARVEQTQGRHDEALMRARDIVESREGARMLAAYDVIAHSLEARGDAQGALEALRQAADQVPSPRRHRALGEAAFRQGDLMLANACMSKVLAATRHSVTAQVQDVLTMAQTLVDLGQPEQAQQVLADKAHPPMHNAYDPASAVVAAIEAQALSARGQLEAAQAALDRASSGLVDSACEFASVAVARAEIVTGRVEAGLNRMQRALASDHENTRLQQIAARALERTGHADKVDAMVAQATTAMKTRIDHARSLLRGGDPGLALAAIEATLAKAPSNTGVLLEATQIACMSLRLSKRLDDAVVVRARSYLARLEQLLPGSDRVARMQRYLRDTLEALMPGHSTGRLPVDSAPPPPAAVTAAVAASSARPAAPSSPGRDPFAGLLDEPPVPDSRPAWA